MVNGTMKEFEKIGIVGGGTAGYLSALSLKKAFPNIRVDIIESPNIPVLGVGESTTPKLLRLLHDFLEFDVKEFYSEVKPTWKLGVRYLWGRNKHGFANNALGVINPFESYVVNGDINYNSLNSRLMDSEKSFIIETNKSKQLYRSLALPHSYAYHLDNENLVNYLIKKSMEFGVNHLSTEIKEVVLNEQGEVSRLIDAENNSLEYDFYIDCSGFKSILLSKLEKNSFVPYNDTLFTDRAVTGHSPHNGTIKVYTEARTMANGWQWSIPCRTSDHLGYVYSSKFCSDAEAEKEFRSLNPNLGESKIIHFKSGRHQNFISHNVAAVGNAYGFVEALQSSALHMVITNVYALLYHIDSMLKGRDKSSVINSALGEIWDSLRWFIGFQFKYNTYLDTDFWKHCNKYSDDSGMKEMISLFKEKGTLHFVKNQHENLKEKEKSLVYGLFSHDFMLLVNNIYPNLYNCRLSPEEKKSCEHKYNLWNQLASRAIPQAEALKIVEENPDILEMENFFEKPFSLANEYKVFESSDFVNFVATS